MVTRPCAAGFLVSCDRGLVRSGSRAIGVSWGLALAARVERRRRRRPHPVGGRCARSPAECCQTGTMADQWYGGQSNSGERWNVNLPCRRWRGVRLPPRRRDLGDRLVGRWRRVDRDDRHRRTDGVHRRPPITTAARRRRRCSRCPSPRRRWPRFPPLRRRPCLRTAVAGGTTRAPPAATAATDPPATPTTDTLGPRRRYRGAGQRRPRRAGLTRSNARRATAATSRCWRRPIGGRGDTRRRSAPCSTATAAAATCAPIRRARRSRPSKDGEPIYVVYLGPFPVDADACRARSQGPSGAYVRRLSNDLAPSHSVTCG